MNTSRNTNPIYAHIENFLNGDEKSFCYIDKEVRRYSHWVLRTNFLESEYGIYAEDLVADSVIKVLNVLRNQQYKLQESSFFTYIHKVLKNFFTDRLRRDPKMRIRIVPLSQINTRDNNNDSIDNSRKEEFYFRETGPDAIELLLEREVRQAQFSEVHRRMARLSAIEREVTYLRYKEEKRPVEIAQLLNISFNTARARLHYAHNELGAKFRKRKTLKKVPC